MSNSSRFRRRCPKRLEAKRNERTFVVKVKEQLCHQQQKPLHRPVPLRGFFNRPTFVVQVSKLASQERFD